MWGPDRIEGVALGGRWARPAAERATHRWLPTRSGLGELRGGACETVGAGQPHRASDAWGKPREALEAHLFHRALGLCDRQPTGTLDDLAHTCGAGQTSG